MRKLQDRRQFLLILILVTGFFMGSALPELFSMGTGNYAGFFSLYSLQKFKQASVNSWELFPYILSSRLKSLLFLWMSSFTAAGILFHCLYAWWLGAAAGMLLALFALRDGYEGFLLFFCCLFPQWILYTAMWKREVLFLFRKHSETEEKYANKRRNPLWELGLMSGYCLLGSLAEAFLGIWTLKIFLQILT